jgi:hypothetical protein
MRTRLAPFGLRLSIAFAGALPFSACAHHADTVRLASTAPLHLSRVVLYENGIAHYERTGHADANAVDLVVPETQADDVLRSLTVVDDGDAAITGVRILPGSGAGDVTLRVGLAADGARALRVTYVTETPAWRPTYRLVVEDGGRVHVQGLAVVDNPTSEDWSDVALTLSTEVPLSFRFDLREARTTFRPRFGADGHLVMDEAAPAPSVLDVPALGPSEVNIAYGMAQRDQPEMSTRAGTLVGSSTSTSAGASDSASSSALLAFEDRPEASGGVFGSVEGFDLGRGESGLVPFVDATTEGSLAIVFKPSPGGALSQEHPYRAVLFQSPADAALLTGPVAIYAGDRFVGDGVTGAIAARAHAFVPYAIERSVRVETSAGDVEDQVRATSLVGGVLTVELRAVHREHVTMTASAPPDAPAYAFVSAMEGFEPAALPDGAITTGQGYFLPLAIDASGHGDVTLDLVRRTTSQVNLAATPGHPYVSALLAFLPESEETARLRAIADRLLSIHHELETAAEDLAVERTALAERRDALEALHGLGSGGAVRTRLAASVATGVSHVDALASREALLRAESITLGEEWYALLRALGTSRR